MDMTLDSSSSRPGALRRSGATERLSSRMIERYLTDIEEGARSDETSALRAALALPAIATALEESDGCTSCDRFTAWCAQWVGMEEVSTSEEALYAMWCEHRGCDELAAKGCVPTAALRQLRLRRHARPTPLLSLPIVRAAPLIECYSEAIMSAALVQAMRRWYDEHGARSPAVQRNLARLAILR